MKKLIAVLLGLSPLALLAQGYQLNLQSVRQTAMGSTGVALPQDASALYFNPGSAAFLSSNSVSGGVFPVISKGIFTDRASSKVNTADNPLVTPLYVHALFGNPQSRVRYGLSVYTPYGSTMKWKNDFTGHFEITKISLLSVAIQPTVSVKVTDKLGIGAGFVYGYGHLDLKKDLPINESITQFSTAEITTAANSVGYNIGAYYNFSDKLSAGVTYHSALKMKSSNGKATFDAPASLAAQFPNQGIKATLPLPDNLSIGLSYKPNKKLTLAADFVTANWKPYDTITIQYSQHTANLTDTKLVRLYKRAYSYRIGAQYKFNNQWDGRVGLSYNKSPIPNDLVNPDVPDADRLNPSVGLGYTVSPKFRIDASFLYEHIKRSGENRLSHITGDYKFNLFLPGIGLTYQF